MMILKRKLSSYVNNNRHSKMVEFCEAINALPGITVDTFTDIANTETRLHFGDKAHIFFHLQNESGSLIQNNQPTGLFFLTRCLDRRYFRYGHKCQINLSIGDLLHDDGALPIAYCLEFESKSILESCDFIQEALDNFYHHINSQSFISTFQIDLSKFHLVDKVQEDRADKLNTLGI